MSFSVDHLKIMYLELLQPRCQLPFRLIHTVDPLQRAVASVKNEVSSQKAICTQLCPNTGLTGICVEEKRFAKIREDKHCIVNSLNTESHSLVHSHVQSASRGVLRSLRNPEHTNGVVSKSPGKRFASCPEIGTLSS